MAQQALNALCLARIAEAVGEAEVTAKFRSEHAALTKRINELMWDKENVKRRHRHPNLLDLGQ